MSTKLHGSGLYSHVPTEATGVTVYKDGLETAASAAAGRAVTNIDDIKQDTSWRAADTDPANTRLLCRLDKRESVGAVPLGGLEEMTGPDDAVRIRWDDRFAEQPAVDSAVTGDSGFSISETASWSLLLICRHPGSLFSASEVAILDIAKTGAASAATRMASIAVTPDAGTLRTRVERCGGVSQTEDHAAAALDDGAWHVVEVVCTDGGGSGATISVAFDGTDLGDHTITTVFGTNGSLAVRLKGGAHIGFIALYSAALSSADLDLLRCQTLDGTEQGLVAGYNCDEGTSTTLGDITGTYDVTLSAGTWTTAQNPVARYAPAAAPRWHAWRRRNALVCTSTGAGDVTTGATAVATSQVVHVLALLRFRKRKPAAARTLGYFGSASTLTDFDWLLELQTDGTLRFRANRHDAGSAVTNVDSTTDVTTGDLIRLSARITWGDAMSLAINATEEATGTAPSYTADATTQFVLHAGDADFEVAYLLVSRRPYTHAEADAILQGTAPVIPTPSCDPDAYLLYSMREGTGSTVANDADFGGTTDLTVASAAASWDVDAIDNPAPGALQGTLSDRVSQVFWEIAPGVDYDCLEILIELYAPGAANAPTVYSLYTYVVLWTEIGIPSGQGAGVGPPVDFSGAQVSFGGPEDTGRRLAYAFPLLSPAEAANLSHHAIEARRTRRDGDTSPMRPMALIYRTSDRWRWPETCAIIIPDLPRWVADGSRSTSWEYAIEIGGQEVRYGSSA